MLSPSIPFLNDGLQSLVLGLSCETVLPTQRDQKISTLIPSLSWWHLPLIPGNGRGKVLRVHRSKEVLSSLLWCDGCNPLLPVDDREKVLPPIYFLWYFSGQHRLPPLLPLPTDKADYRQVQPKSFNTLESPHFCLLPQKRQVIDRFNHRFIIH